jgi:hypothetical protein
VTPVKQMTCLRADIEGQEDVMRKVFFWAGWAVLFVLPVIYAIQVYLTQDLPTVEPWKWLIPFAAAVVIYASRNRDDVLKHHVVG